jgi:hypothetical protein
LGSGDIETRPDLAEVRKAERPPRLIGAKPGEADASRPAFEGSNKKNLQMRIIRSAARAAVYMVRV